MNELGKNTVQSCDAKIKITAFFTTKKRYVFKKH